MRSQVVALVMLGAASVCGCIQAEPGGPEEGRQTGQAEAPLSRSYCEAQRDAILAVCNSPATPPNLKAACIASAWIGFTGCLRLPGDA